MNSVAASLQCSITPFLDSPLLRRAATVVWHWCYIADHAELEADRLQSAHGRFAPGPRTFDQHFDFLETVAHGLPGRILRYHLCSVGRAFTRAFESNFAGARPSDD